MHKAKKSKAKRTSSKPTRKPKPDASQTALAAVEKIIGGKLYNGTHRAESQKSVKS